MEAEDRIGILKFVLMVISGIFVILGIAIFGCGVWILFDKSNFIAIISNEDSVRFLSGGFFVIGLVVAAISLIGCLGALKEVRYFLLLYMGALIVILLGQGLLTIILLIKGKEITKTLSDEVDKIIMDYGNGTNREMEIKWNILDTMQLYWTCCGRTNYTQWENNSYIKSCIEWEVYPCSCFNTTSCPFLSEDPSQRFGKGEKVFNVGCQTHMEEWIYQNGLVMLGMDLGLVLIQVFLIVICVYLFRSLAQKAKS
ncbi:tetraspanin-19 [Paramormyrops kingsleyae]|uniref:tetraspanin-19 n=1 Tax=Paramormyrops kingsleyae TaxID=1676925 RepID=UPI000CD5FB06|nr:putative tetraspanin-19 [Paramormyrops kingsleyae]